MILEKEISKLLSDLASNERSQVCLNGCVVSVNVEDQGKTLLLTTPVYYGGNYIPKSVRSSLKQKAPFDQLRISTSLEIDEDNFSVSLKYRGEMAPVGYNGIVDLLEDFSWLAEKWRDYLDEKDRNDLVYVPVQ